MLRLGGGVLPFDSQLSSIKKGESLEGELSGVTNRACRPSILIRRFGAHDDELC